MARIRTIKPEFWSSEQIVELSTTARLLFIGLWNFCDDAGNHPASARTLKMQVFPGDDFTAEQISAFVQEMIAAGLIIEYQADTKTYWHVTGWHHQKIEKPNHKYPPAPGQKFAEQSASGRRPLAPGREKEKEVEKEKEGREKNTPARNGQNQNQKKQENIPPLQPSNGYDQRYFENIIKEINRWARPNDWQPLRDFAHSVGYDPAKYGPVADEVKKFVTYWLDPDRNPYELHADPAQFFQDKGRKWLLDAKNFNKPKNGHQKPPPKYEPPPNRRINGNAQPATLSIGDIAGKIITEM